MKVRELISNALDFIGVNTVGIENLDGHEFLRNLRQLQLLADTLRLKYPFRQIDFYELDELENIPFVNIESVTTSEDFNVGPIFTLQSISLDEYNRMRVIPNLVDIPKYYYFERPSKLKVFPINSSYGFQISGKVNTLGNLMADSDLSAISPFIQDYLEKKLAQRLFAYYKKTMTPEQKAVINECVMAYSENSQTETTIATPDSDMFFDRPKYYVRNL